MPSSSQTSFFSRLSSSATSVRSNSSSATSLSSSNTPKGCREFQRARYAKDGKGFDFNLTYPYGTSSTEDFAVTEIPAGCRDFKLRYARDSKGHDFTSTYSYAVEDYPSTLEASDDTPMGCRDFKTMRYAKDGKGYDFEQSYPYKN